MTAPLPEPEPPTEVDVYDDQAYADWQALQDVLEERDREWWAGADE